MTCRFSCPGQTFLVTNREKSGHLLWFAFFSLACASKGDWWPFFSFPVEEGEDRKTVDWTSPSTCPILVIPVSLVLLNDFSCFFRFAVLLASGVKIRACQKTTILVASSPPGLTDVVAMKRLPHEKVVVGLAPPASGFKIHDDYSLSAIGIILPGSFTCWD